MEPTVSGRFTPASRAFALRGTVAALMGIGLLTSVSVRAQDAGASQDANQANGGNNVVVVSGQRQAAQSAQTIKKNADQVLDSIVADDIGKFPDKNVAEILARVTGVQVLRGAGEASTVVIRGLGGAKTLFNGREMFTAASRSLFLADVPVSMLQRVDVYKSQGADMVEGGTAGTIDVRTFRPFDFKGSQVAINARAENRDKAGKTDPQVGGLWSNRWKTGIGEVGLLGGLSYQRGRYSDEVAWAGQPATYQANGQTVQGADGNGRVMTTGDRKRLALNFAAQWRPNRDMQFYAEGFGTKIDHDAQSVFFVGGFPVNSPTSTIKTITENGKNYLDSISNPSDTSLVLSSTQARRDWSKGSQLAVGGTWDATPTIRLSTEAVRTVSTTRQENPILDSIYTAPHAVVGGTRDGGGYVDYPGTDLTDPSKWTMIALYDNHNHANGSANDWRGDVSWTPENDGLLKELSGGLRWAQRDASYAHELGNYRPATITGQNPGSVPGLSCLSPETHGNYGINQYYAACYNFLLDNTSVVRQAILGTPNGLPDDPLSFYTDRETSQAIYGKAKLGFDAFGVPIDATAGVRVVNTKQSVNGNSRSGTGPVTPVAVSTSNTDVLPSLNLRANFRNDLVGRLVYGKAIERAAFGDYNPGVVLGSVTTTNGNPPGGSGGNPNLKPQEARNLDVALEWYFAKDGSVTGTVFQHDFKNFIRHKTTTETINGQAYLMDRPYNTDTAKLYGFEGAYQQFFSFLPGWLSGLGMQANFTYMNGGMTEPDGTRNTFPGMSKRAYNLVGLYERGPWSARVAYNWRDKFVDTYNYRGLGLDLVVDPIKTLDASISYKITDNLTATLDGSNLLDQEYHDYHGTPLLPRDVRRYDRVVGFALRWKH
ncbi:TonB-dependent receptor [Massilia sp. CT11-137]|uniref:TonB-dependent receptor n=1 Tax=Massilia sp. CT11-137 TaxID=3393901 RepID=UPI0039AFF8B7